MGGGGGGLHETGVVGHHVGDTRWGGGVGEGGYMRLVPWDMGRYKMGSGWKERAANGRLAVGEKFCQHNPILSFCTGVLCQCRSVPVCWRVSQPPCGSAGA